MAFRLLVECSKDIDKLEIDFSDGTSVIRHTGESPDVALPKRKGDFLSTDDIPVEEISQEIIQKPFIDDIKKGINVAPELQNLDI